MPASVKVAVAVTALVLALLGLEVFDGVVRGQLARSLFWLVPGLVVFWGLVRGRRRAWYWTRGLSAVHAVLYIVVALIAAVGPGLSSVGLRAWIAGVSLMMAALLVTVVLALGRPAARQYFGLACPSVPVRS